MSVYSEILERLRRAPCTWAVTGAAGFIGSNLVEALLRAGQRVRGLDNFSAGYRRNLDLVRAALSPAEWANFTFIEGDIRDLPGCRELCSGVDFVLHEAALGSVPLSIEDPIRANQNNVDGFLNMLVAARDAKVKGFVYASSSAVYGNAPEGDERLPKSEDRVGKMLSPYALTKYADELYAGVFAAAYGFRAIGLRYFNIFGPRQDPQGAYAAVIPKWIDALLRGGPVRINGDGKTTRDFCHIDNCVQANILAAAAPQDGPAWNRAYNVGLGESTDLNELFAQIRRAVAVVRPEAAQAAPEYRDFRAGDIKHSVADISRTREYLGYAPAVSLAAGLLNLVQAVSLKG